MRQLTTTTACVPSSLAVASVLTPRRVRCHQIRLAKHSSCESRVALMNAKTSRWWIRKRKMFYSGWNVRREMEQDAGTNGTTRRQRKEATECSTDSSRHHMPKEHHQRPSHSISAPTWRCSGCVTKGSLSLRNYPSRSTKVRPGIEYRRGNMQKLEYPPTAAVTPSIGFTHMSHTQTALGLGSIEKRLSKLRNTCLTTITENAWQFSEEE